MQQKNKLDRASVRKLISDITILFGPQIITTVLETLKTFDFGQYQAVVGLGITAGLYLIKRYQQGETPATAPVEEAEGLTE